MGAVGATLNVERLIALAAPQTLRSSGLQASQAGSMSLPVFSLRLARQQSKPDSRARHQEIPCTSNVTRSHLVSLGIISGAACVDVVFSAR